MVGKRNTKKVQDEINIENAIVTEIATVSVEKPKKGRRTKKEMIEQEQNQANIILNVQENADENENAETNEDVKTLKKRGRKPKGGKIIQALPSIEQPKNVRPNIILHLKCSMKDLMNIDMDTSIDSYNFGSKSELFNIINENITIENYTNANANTKQNNKWETTTSNYCEECDDDNDDNDDSNKDVWKKLKILEHNLHINNVNKKSACFWDTCEFDNPPIYIPKYYINGTYHVYGCFCSPECGVAYLMNETIDSSTKFERYHLFNHIYAKIYDYKKNIKPAPNPYYMLEKFYGNLKIHEYRSLLRNERLFLIVDKPLTRILPELHEDNDEFLLNSKIIPSNNTTYQIKNKLASNKKKQTKTNILNEKFGASSEVYASAI
jgi:hypothetical protein